MPALVLPFEGLSSAGRLVVFLLGVVGALVFGGAQNACGKVMKRTGGVNVVEFELIGTWTRADPVMEKWRTAENGAGRRAGLWSLLFDLFFIAAYVVLVVVAAAAAGSYFTTRRWPGWHGFAVAVAAIGAAIGLLDVVEDVGLLLILVSGGGGVGGHSVNWPGLATGASRLKWALTFSLLPAALVTLGLAVLP